MLYGVKHCTNPVSAIGLAPAELLRVCRDLAWSEIAAMPAVRQSAGSRMDAHTLNWSVSGLALDSLACMQLATAAATWCNAHDAGFEDLFLAKRQVGDWAHAMQRAREAGARHITFSSSGSTGARQHVRHREELLADEARAWALVLRDFAAVQRVINLVPTHHIYGCIWGLLLPQALQVPVCDAELAALPELQPGDVIVAVPDQWAWLAEAARLWPAGVQGVSSTAPLAADVHRRLVGDSADGRQPFRQTLARLIQVYGATETAGLAWRDGPDEPYTLAPGRARGADDGIALTWPDGSTTPLKVPDQLRWADARRFELLRRLDHSVQVAGHNVSPAWVEQQLRGHAAVQDAAVRLDDDPARPRLKAFVVPLRPEDLAQRAAFEAWVAQTLPWYAAFSSITYGQELPRNVMGKLSNWPV